MIERKNKRTAKIGIFAVAHNTYFSQFEGLYENLMGHTMEAMYDMHADPTAISASFPVHVPLLEVDDVIELYNEVTQTPEAFLPLLQRNL